MFYRQINIDRRINMINVKPSLATNDRIPNKTVVRSQHLVS